MKNRRYRSRGQRGLSLLEALVGLALTGIVMGGIQTSYRAQVYALESQKAAYSLQDATRGALDLMVREIRMAGYDPTGAALVVTPGPACPGVPRGITEATPTRLHLVTDLDGNGVTTGNSEDVIYELDTVNGEIHRTDVNGTAVLAENLTPSGLTFRYFDTSNPPVELVAAPALAANDLDCVGSVSVEVHMFDVNPDPNVSTNLYTTARSQVAIRSRTLANF